MALVGYARVSSSGQSLEVQREQLAAAGVEPDLLFEEKRSGTTTKEREQLRLALRTTRKGDVFVVTKLDRLARSLVDLRQIVDDLTARGVGFRVLDQRSIDTTTADGKLMLNILASFAEWENELRRERQADGIAKAKEANKYKGRKPTARAKADDVHRLKAEGVGPSEISRRLGIGLTSVRRILAEAS